MGIGDDILRILKEQYPKATFEVSNGKLYAYIGEGTQIEWSLPTHVTYCPPLEGERENDFEAWQNRQSYLSHVSLFVSNVRTRYGATLRG